MGAPVSGTAQCEENIEHPTSNSEHRIAGPFCMKQFLVTVPRNLMGCFTGWRIVWHVVAILLTLILVMSGFDWRWFLATRNPALRSWMWPAVGIGALLPLALPLVLLIVGFIIQNSRTILAGWAVGQAELLGVFVTVVYKAVTGRVVAHRHRFRHGRDGVHALSETAVAGLGGDPLRRLCWPGCFHDHPLVFGFRGRSDHRLGHRSRGREGIWETPNIRRLTRNIE
jgi:hypothetical protein